MYTTDIQDFFEKIGLSSCVLVTASDCLPDRVPNNSGIVINLSPSTESGSHWVSIHFDHYGCATYFDSYGVPPSVPSIQNFLRIKCRTVTINNFAFQQTHSNVCGQYSCVFLSHMLTSNIGIDFFCKFFSINSTLNDSLIRKLFAQILSSHKNRA